MVGAAGTCTREDAKNAVTGMPMLRWMPIRHKSVVHPIRTPGFTRKVRLDPALCRALPFPVSVNRPDVGFI